MKKELQLKLYAKYPMIFAQHILPMQQTAMCWGIETSDGWFEIIDKLCEKIMTISASKGITIEAVQVKEKFGELRFYTNHFDEDIEKEIELATEQSRNTCERCGSNDKVTQTKGWIVTLCQKCMKGK